MIKEKRLHDTGAFLLRIPEIILLLQYDLVGIVNYDLWLVFK